MLLNSTPVAETEYSDFTVIAEQMYFYVVSAVDSSNVQSPSSNDSEKPAELIEQGQSETGIALQLDRHTGRIGST